MTPEPVSRALVVRLWIYQAERFPIGKHGLLIAAFASSGVCLSALLAGRIVLPSWTAFSVAFGVMLGLFLLLRIADEFKDAATDARYRPERPVPRGLVSLGELAGVGVGVVSAQFLGVIVYAPGLLLPLALVWGYLYLMSREFYCATWLKAHPLSYMLSHMLIMPLIDLFATACEWMPTQGVPPPGLASFLALSFSNGLIIELGRKTWAPTQERVGVESYSAAWGLGRALGAWVAAVASALGLAVMTAAQIAFSAPVLGVLGLLGGLMLWAAGAMAKRPTAAAARRIEQLSGVWVLASYLLLGLIPLSLRVWG